MKNHCSEEPPDFYHKETQFDFTFCIRNHLTRTEKTPRSAAWYLEKQNMKISKMSMINGLQRNLRYFCATNALFSGCESN